MTTSRSSRSADTLLPHSLFAVTAVHGSGLPLRLRLLALLIALAITMATAPFGPAATDDADRDGRGRSHGFGRHAPLMPVIDGAE
ncbi:hypothetical protein [Microbacterium sp. NPDC056569]|uniref:hypothetical protein n=1 Tax=Microbacterium sp. NPDC056569 TaxID=3345867 RepID=UPI00366C8A0D